MSLWNLTDDTYKCERIVGLQKICQRLILATGLSEVWYQDGTVYMFIQYIHISICICVCVHAYIHRHTIKQTVHAIIYATFTYLLPLERCWLNCVAILKAAVCGAVELCYGQVLLLFCPPKLTSVRVCLIAETPLCAVYLHTWVNKQCVHTNVYEHQHWWNET